MSGIEIGGLVLAVFPAVILALESYQEGRQVLRRLDTKIYQSEIDGVLLELEVQSTIFRNTYLNLLRLVLTQQSVIKILMDPDGLEEHSSFITDRLKKQLGSQWNIYTALMKRLHTLLETLRLHIEKSRSNDSNEWLDKAAFMLISLRFSFTVRHRQGLLSKVKDDNLAFRTLVEQKNTLRHLEGSLVHHNQVKDYRELEDQTAKLVHVIESQFDCASLQHDHSMGLYLRSCIPSGEQSILEPRDIMNKENGISIWIDSSCGNTHYRQNFLFDGMCSRDHCSHPQLCFERDADAESVLLFSRLPKTIPHLQVGDTVCFLPRESSQAATLSTNKNFCLTGLSAHHTMKVANFEDCEDISLHGILAGRRHFSRFPGYFFERDRLVLAFLISVSSLCLYQSQWVNSSLSTRDVFVPIYVENDTMRQASLSSPFVKKPIPRKEDLIRCSQSATASPGIIPRPPSNTSTFGIRSRPLYDLGKMLLELVLNASLSSFQSPNNPTETEDQIAWRLEDEVCGRAGPVWADIISKCLHCPFEGVPDIKDDAFASAVHAGIIRPLFDMLQLPRLSSRTRLFRLTEFGTGDGGEG
ncbi:hypothetical protein BJX99DRAFT_262208 [Aspergillus californicus]